MADKNFDLDNVIKDSGNATVFVYVDTTAIAYAMVCCMGAFAASSPSSNGQAESYETVMTRMLSTLDRFLENDKKRRENIINEIKDVMQKRG